MAIAAALKLTTSRPELLRKSRREVVPFQFVQHLFDLFRNVREGRHATTSSPDDRLRQSAMRLRGALDGGLNAVVRHAAAQGAGHPLADLRIGRIRIPVQQHLGGHDLPVLAEAALRNLLVNPGLLHGMQRAVLGQSFERGDLALVRRRPA